MNTREKVRAMHLSYNPVATVLFGIRPHYTWRCPGCRKNRSIRDDRPGRCACGKEEGNGPEECSLLKPCESEVRQIVADEVAFCPDCVEGGWREYGPSGVQEDLFGGAI